MVKIKQAFFISKLNFLLLVLLLFSSSFFLVGCSNGSVNSIEQKGVVSASVEDDFVNGVANIKTDNNNNNNNNNDGGLSRGDCRFGRVDCAYPGSCARYVDADNNGFCDHGA